MKRLTATLCLTIAVLLGSAGAGYALPPCPSDQSGYYDNCFGTYTKASGAKYVGEWKGGKEHGQGTYSWADGDIYVGEYRDDKKHGQGTYTTANGSKYVGEFRDGERNGQGTYTYADGSKYVGEFKDGNSHGKSIQYHADGTVEKEGIWKDDKFQYAQKVTPPAVARKPPTSAPRKRTDPDKVVAAASGSGFAVSSKGHVITNNHVIEGCQNVKIHHNGKAILATVATYGPQNDLALLKGNFRPSTVLPLSSDRPELLQDV